MSKHSGDLPKDKLDEKLDALIQDINKEMLNDSSAKLPNYRELGKRLAECIGRKEPYSVHAISDSMGRLQYKKDTTRRQFLKKNSYEILGYIADPSLVYLPNEKFSDKRAITKWASENFPQSYLDFITTDKGIILIGSTSTFSTQFIKRYDKNAINHNVKLKKET